MLLLTLKFVIVEFEIDCCDNKKSSISFLIVDVVVNDDVFDILLFLWLFSLVKSCFNKISFINIKSTK